MIKRFGIFTFLTLLASPLMAFSNTSDFKIPVDRDGYIVQDVQQVGVLPLTIRSSDKTPAFVAGSSIAIYGMLCSTAGGGSPGDTLSHWVNFRATNTANVTSALLIPSLRISSVSVVPSSGNFTVEPPYLKNRLYVFNPPLIAPDGLSLDMSSFSTAGIEDISSQTSVTVFYRFLSTTSDEQTWVPIDRTNGAKARSSSLYGVKVASMSGPGQVDDDQGTSVLDGKSAEFAIEGSSVTASRERRLLYGVCYGTGTADAFVIFEDTNVVTGNSVSSLPPIFYRTLDLSFGGAVTNNISGCYTFPWPIVHVIGLTTRRTPGTDQFRVLSRPSGRLR